MRLKRFRPFLALALLLALNACSPAGGGTGLTADSVDPGAETAAPAGQYRVALVMKTLTNPFFVEMEKGARRAEAEFGVKLIVKTGAEETSIEQQIQIVEELIRQKVDAVVIAPGSSVDLVKVLKKAKDAGICIVNIDNRLDPAECARQGLAGVPFVSVRNDEGAYLSAQKLASYATAPCNAAIVEGIRDAENAELRKQGAIKAFSENPNITVVASESADWKLDEAHTLARQIFRQHPDIGLVFCANDMMALGVAQYLKESGNSGVRVAGFDNLAETRQDILDGRIVATVDQQADAQGYMGVECAVRLIRGQAVDDETYVPVKLITKESLQ